MIRKSLKVKSLWGLAEVLLPIFLGFPSKSGKCICQSPKRFKINPKPQQIKTKTKNTSLSHSPTS